MILVKRACQNGTYLYISPEDSIPKITGTFTERDGYHPDSRINSALRLIGTMERYDVQRIEDVYDSQKVTL